MPCLELFHESNKLFNSSQRHWHCKQKLSYPPTDLCPLSCTIFSFAAYSINSASHSDFSNVKGTFIKDLTDFSTVHLKNPLLSSIAS
ncbi:hypothetical protein DY000_02005507 [Brassica cretica]|uniref:Uncharacterized protein n=1 Tax=Brassica cretica TaxID=69181 RepID=A0ABQ7C5Q1_BRACR|nr:hypothetical protein DY000_02005507 [Brassica cretica]